MSRSEETSGSGKMVSVDEDVVMPSAEPSVKKLDAYAGDVVKWFGVYATAIINELLGTVWQLSTAVGPLEEKKSTPAQRMEKFQQRLDRVERHLAHILQQLTQRP